MKSSTLHRSNLTKERMELLREIKAQKRTSNDSTPGIYVRPTKEKELDVLWQSFKVNQKDEKSPALYMVAGFIVGAIAMFLMTAVISFAAHSASEEGNFTFHSTKTGDIKTTPKEIKALPTMPSETNISRSKNKSKDKEINFLPPDTAKTASTSTKVEQYTIKPGDTLDNIALRFYGQYNSTQINKIATTNNITNPNRISIGQVLTIPLD